MKNYDVIIIGAGTAGLSARREVAKQTDNYLVVDGGELGTTCARVGCMPSKVLLQVAEDYHRRHSFSQQGILNADKIEIDHAKVFQHVRSLRDRFVRAVLEDMNTWTSTHLLKGYATFVDQNVIEVGGQRLSADRIIIATGSTPVYPKAWDAFRKYFIDTDTFFELEEVPENVAVIGAGVIGLELGQALSRIGVNTRVIGNAPALGGLSDPKLQDYALKKLQEEMELSIEGANLVREENNRLVIQYGKDEFHADKVLLAVGRRPNLDKLGLDRINLKLDARGIPSYDEVSYQVQDSPIYIVGDVNNEAPVLHEASDQGRIAGYNAVRKSNQCFAKRDLLRITFSAPNIAVVGKPFSSLNPDDIVIGEVSYEGQGRAIVKLKEKGLVRIYASKNEGKILGAEIFAPEGEHMAHLLSWSISLGLNVRKILSLPFYHPVLEEGLRTAFRQIAEQVKATEDLELFRCDENSFDHA